MHLGIDAFWGALPHGQLDLQQVRPDARHLAIRVFLDEGINVISDDLIWTREWLVDFLSIFESYDVWPVGLHVSTKRAPGASEMNVTKTDNALLTTHPRDGWKLTYWDGAPIPQ